MRGHNPVDLAGNLAGLSLTLRTGNGKPGGADGSGYDPVEETVHIQATTLHKRLDALGIAHTWDDYGAGGHTWHFWKRDLRKSLPAHHGDVRAATQGAVAVLLQVRRRRLPRLGLARASSSAASALELSSCATPAATASSSSGSRAARAEITTAPLFKRGAKVRVTVRGTTSSLRADRSGTLHVVVPLSTRPVRVAFAVAKTKQRGRR